MVDQRLLDYIKTNLSRGISLEEIRKTLLSYGWSNKDIDEAVNLAIPKKQTSRAEIISKLPKTGGTIFGIFFLVKTIFQFIIATCIISFFILIGLPLYIGIIPLVLIIIFIILQIIRVKRIVSVKLDVVNTNVTNTDEKITNVTNTDEKIIDYIAGIMRTFHIRGYGVLGVGKIVTPENAIIITNKRIIFVVVPLPGGERIVAGVDIPMWQWLLAKKDIENKLKEMINSMSIESIIHSNPKNYWINYNEIEKIKFSKFSSRNIEIVKRDGKKLKYAIRDKKDLKKIELIKSFCS